MVVIKLILGLFTGDSYLVDVDNGLPLVTVDGHSTVLASSEVLMELSMREFIGLLDKYFI